MGFNKCTSMFGIASVVKLSYHLFTYKNYTYVGTYFCCECFSFFHINMISDEIRPRLS